MKTDNFLSLKEYPLVRDKKHIVPYAFVKQNSILPLKEEKDRVIVASSDPLNFSAQDELRLILNKEIEVFLSSKEELNEAIELCYHQKEEETKRILKDLNKKNNISTKEDIEGYDLLENSSDSDVIRFLNAVFLEAIQQNASDIHFEPVENGINVRYRIDGILQNRHFSLLNLKTQLIARIKVMSKLDISETRLPQDGRIKLKLGKREIDFRVSIVPTVYGERVNLRILDRMNIVLGLDNIGMHNNMLTTFKRLIKASEGIILVTGPTGSGKTTTLYSAICEINSPEVNIMTIEDPVEYKIASIAQIGVSPKIGLSFARGLKHILRQDPDIIMVGEIRDKETAEIAIQAALTGHLVLTTLHTNDAPSAITRLLDMGIEPYLISSALIGVLAQRLVRKTCTKCQVAYKPREEELKEIKMTSEFNECFYKAEGCNDCFNSGYKGRHGIYELMLTDTYLKDKIMQRADAESLRKEAIQNGMMQLLFSGQELIKRGITTTKEVLRVVNLGGR
jgi:general secretion pathway protein E